MSNHAENIGQAAVLDLVFEIDDDDLLEVVVGSHDTDCLSPTMRNKPGWLSVSIWQPSKVRQLSEILCQPFRRWEGIIVARFVDLVAFNAAFFLAADLRPQRLGLLARFKHAGIPAVVEISRWDVTQEKRVVGLGGERQAKA